MSPPPEDHQAPPSGDIILFLTRMEDKITALTNSVNEYKTDTSVGLAKGAEKTTQLEEKVVQLFKFHNEFVEKFRELFEETKTNRHDLANQQQQISLLTSMLEAQKKDLKSESELIRIDMKGGLEKLTKTIGDLSDKIDANEKADAADRNKIEGKKDHYKAIGWTIAAMSGLATVGAFLYMLK